MREWDGTVSWASVDLVESEDWPLQFFKPSELACKGDGSLVLHGPSALMLDELRFRMGRELRITSGYRSPAYNAKVGGAKRSYHLKGRAFDVEAKTWHQRVEIFCRAYSLGFRGFGWYEGFLHVDTGPKRSWHA